eukprot:947155-Alexandrium_andersonii.AAC.1
MLGAPALQRLTRTVGRRHGLLLPPRLSAADGEPPALGPSYGLSERLRARRPCRPSKPMGQRTSPPWQPLKASQ